MTTLTATLSTIDFALSVKSLHIKGTRPFSSYTVYALCGTDLITISTKTQLNHTNSNFGKGHTQRLKLNGKAISASELTELFKGLGQVEVLYSKNEYDLKVIRKERKEAIAETVEVVEIAESKEIPAVIVIANEMISVTNETSMIRYTNESTIHNININKAEIDKMLNDFDVSERANVMMELIKNMNEENKIKMFM